MPEDQAATEDPKHKPRLKGTKQQKLKQLRREHKLNQARERKAAKQEAKRLKREERENAKALKKGKPAKEPEEPKKERNRTEAREPRRDKEPKEEPKKEPGSKKEPKKKKAPKAKKQKKAKPPKKKKKKKAKKEGGEKKGKMPVMIALVVILLGGGFFGFKMMSGGGEELPPPIKLGDETHVMNLGEFLVNTSDGKTFLRATIGLHMADGTALFHADGGHDDGGPGFEMTAPYTDAVRSVLRRQTLAQLMSEDGERAIKIQIAAAVNEVYARYNHDDEEGHEKDPADGEHPEEEEPEVIDESWHSQTGPVLIVYLTDYVWE